jgi:hypothetical protein
MTRRDNYIGQAGDMISSGPSQELCSGVEDGSGRALPSSDTLLQEKNRKLLLGVVYHNVSLYQRVPVRDCE